MTKRSGSFLVTKVTLFEKKNQPYCSIAPTPPCNPCHAPCILVQDSYEMPSCRMMHFSPSLLTVGKGYATTNQLNTRRPLYGFRRFPLCALRC